MEKIEMSETYVKPTKPQVVINRRMPLRSQILAFACMLGIIALTSYTLVVMIGKVDSNARKPTPVVQSESQETWWQVGIYHAGGDRCWITKDKPAIVGTPSTPRPTNFIRFAPVGHDYYMYLRADYYFPVPVGSDPVPMSGNFGSVEKVEKDEG